MYTGEHTRYTPREHSSTALAVVSGKGGSGKTMVAVALAQAVAISGNSVMLIDADFGTGGLTYYLSFRVFNKLRTGITDLFTHPNLVDTMGEWAARPDASQRVFGLDQVRLVPIGSESRLRDSVDDKLTAALTAAITEAKRLADVVVVDCRGGIDLQSLSVCAAVDEILIVVETDATSIRASQHLVDELQTTNLKPKVSGFVLNKVIDDPTTLAMTANSLLQVDFLGAIPFDIEATRSYIQGKIPDYASLFVKHILALAPKLLPNLDLPFRPNVLSSSDYSAVTLGRPEVKIGSFMLAVLFFYASLAALAALYIARNSTEFVPREYVAIGIALANFVFILMLSDAFKQVIGRIFRRYNSVVKRVFSLGVIPR